jgi:hypothetical protein
MAQQREAPAYQEYAASMMARIDYRAMSLAARGLLYTMRNECWVNGSLPRDPVLLARVLGFTAEEVSSALPAVLPFFTECGAAYRCPELDDYRDHLDQRRQRQSEGGRVGAMKTNSGRHGAPPANPAGKPQVARESLVKTSPAQPSKAKGIEGRAMADPWLSDYERVSRGA